MRHHRDSILKQLLYDLIRLAERIIATLDGEDQTSLQLSIQGEPMANYQLNAGDSVVLTLTDTDDVTGDVVTPDAGSVTVVLSNTADTIVDNLDGTFTLTGGAVAGVGNTATFNATVGGVASSPAVGTYDVIAQAAPDATSLSVSFGTETAPAAATSAPAVAATNRPVVAGAVAQPGE